MMKCLFIITESMHRDQIEDSYILCLAMLNFEHDVDVVFINDAFVSIQNDGKLLKRWLALKFFGVYQLRQLNLTPTALPNEHLNPLSIEQFEALKNAANQLL